MYMPTQYIEFTVFMYEFICVEKKLRLGRFVLIVADLYYAATKYFVYFYVNAFI